MNRDKLHFGHLLGHVEAMRHQLFRSHDGVHQAPGHGFLCTQESACGTATAMATHSGINLRYRPSMNPRPKIWEIRRDDACWMEMVSSGRKASTWLSRCPDIYWFCKVTTQKMHHLFGVFKSNMTPSHLWSVIPWHGWCPWFVPTFGSSPRQVQYLGGVYVWTQDVWSGSPLKVPVEHGRLQ